MNDDLFLRVMLIVLTLAMTFLVEILGMDVYSNWQEYSHCARYEDKIVHQEEYRTFMFVGKVMMPIYHPAGDYKQTVCVEPK